MLLLALPLLALVSCAHATPVAPAPILPEESPKLQASLLGTCEVTGTQKLGGERKEAKGLTWTFNPDGHGKFDIPGGLTFGNTFNYRVEGRNVLTDGVYKAIRIDDWNAPTMTWFMYDLSQTYYCTKL